MKDTSAIARPAPARGGQHPALAAVHAAVERVVPWYSSIHGGAGYRSQVASRAYEGARAAVADFVDADGDHVVVLVRNTTEALNRRDRQLPGRGSLDRARRPPCRVRARPADAQARPGRRPEASPELGLRLYAARRSSGAPCL
jgi:hypothetical protein